MNMEYWLHDMISFARVGQFRRIFQREGASPANRCWCQKTRAIVVLCGIKISAMHRLVLSRYTHLTDGWTDGQNGESIAVHCITCSRLAKTRSFWHAEPHLWN